MNMQAFHSRKVLHLPHKKIVENASLVARVDQLMNGPVTGVAGLLIQIDVPRIGVVLNQEHFYLVLDIVKQNFLDTPTNAPPPAPYIPPKEAMLETLSPSATGAPAAKVEANPNVTMAFSLHLGEFKMSFVNIRKVETKRRSRNRSLGGVPFLSTSSTVEWVNEKCKVVISARGRKIDKMDAVGLSDPYLIVSKLSGRTKVALFKTETIMNTLEPTWKPFEFPAEGLTNEENLVFEVWDYDRTSRDDFIGSFQASLSQLLGSTMFELINPKKRSKKGAQKYTHSGLIDLDCVIYDENNKPMELPNFNQQAGKIPNNKKKKNNDKVEPDEFCDIVFKNMNVKMSMAEDVSTYLGVTLSEMLVLDARPIALIPHVAEVPSLEVKYYMSPNPDQKQKISVKIPSVEFNVIPDILLPLVNMIVPAISRLTGVSPPATDEALIVVVLPPALPRDPIVKIEAIVKIEGINVNLLESTMKKKPNKLTMSTSVVMRYKSFGSNQRTSIIVDDMRMWRATGLGQTDVIHPICMSINYFLSEERGSVTLLSDPMDIILSYQDVTILQGLMTDMGATPTTSVSEYNKTHNPEIPTKVIPVICNVQFNKIQIVLVHECIDVPPLVKILLDDLHLEGDYPGGIAGEFKLAGSYYNLNNTYWEPVFEPWSCILEYRVAEATNGASFVVESNHVLNINVSAALMDVMILWSKSTINVPPGAKAFTPIVLRNLTQYPIYAKLHSMNEPRTIENWQTEPMETKGDASWRELDVLSNNYMSVLLSSLALSNLSITKSGSTILPFDPTAPMDPTNALVYQVLFDKGSRIITFRSVIEILNHSTMDLEIKVTLADGSMYFVPAIPPQGQGSVPLEYAKDGFLHFRPADPSRTNVGWSHKFEIAKMQEETYYLSLPHDGEENFFYGLNVEKHEKGTPIPLWTITIGCPFILENLLCLPMKYRFIDGVTLEGELKKGETWPCYAVSLNHSINFSIWIEGYEWSASTDLNAVEQGSIDVPDKNGRMMTLFFDHIHSEQVLHIVIYAKFWVTNFTMFDIKIHNGKYGLAANQKEEPEFRLSEFTLKDQAKREAEKEHNKVDTPPFMYSYPHPRHRTSSSRHTAFQIEDSKLSKEVTLDAVQKGELNIESNEKDVRNFYFGISVSVAPGRFRRTKIVTIVPRYKFVNRTRRPIFFQQNNHERRLTLETGAVQSFHWPDPYGSKLVIMSFDAGSRWSWSGAFDPNHLGQTYLSLTEKATEESVLIKIHVQEDSRGGLAVVISADSENEAPPYKIHNKTNQILTFIQHDCPTATEHKVPPFETVDFAWDEPTAEHTIDVTVGDIPWKSQINLDALKSGIETAEFIAGVYAEGPTRVFAIGPKTEENLQIIQESQDELGEPTMWAMLKLYGIGISVIDGDPEELMFIAIDRVIVEYASTTKAQSLDMMIHSVQIDNQLYFTPLPIVLRSIKDERRPDFFHLGVLQKTGFKSLWYFKHVHMAFQEMEVAVDTTLINQLLRFFNLNMDKFYGNNQSSNDTYNAMMVYFEVLALETVRVNVSMYSPGDSKPDDPLRQLVGALIDSVPTVNSAPLKLGALVLEHPYCEYSDLMARIQAHYVTQIIRGSYKILGSFDFLGNPVNVFSNLTGGIKDLILAPLTGSASGPAGAAAGLGVGGATLVRKTAYSFFNSGSKITSRVGEGLSKLTVDQNYKEHRKERWLIRPNSIFDGVKEGTRDLGHSVKEGVTGVILEPKKEIERRGKHGIVKGTGKGILGLVFKPTSGVADFLSRTLQGLSVTIWSADFQRQRLPRHFDKRSDYILEPYSQEKAFRQYSLFMTNNARYFNTDYPEYHFINGDVLYLVTDKRVMKIKVDFTKNIFTLLWKMAFERLQSVDVVPTGLSLRKGGKRDFIKAEKEEEEELARETLTERIKNRTKYNFEIDCDPVIAENTKMVIERQLDTWIKDHTVRESQAARVKLGSRFRIKRKLGRRPQTLASSSTSQGSALTYSSGDSGYSTTVPSAVNSPSTGMKIKAKIDGEKQRMPSLREVGSIKHGGEQDPEIKQLLQLREKSERDPARNSKILHTIEVDDRREDPSKSNQENVDYRLGELGSNEVKDDDYVEKMFNLHNSNIVGKENSEMQGIDPQPSLQPPGDPNPPPVDRAKIDRGRNKMLPDPDEKKAKV
eukprot:TRINITY_DN5119_c0_g1_i4.p1 TRINITY_DN5119_c0_g1~~TRINITY_DN5119_c0_g1_i4.p1  ORF type:complete len:2151 (-),score=662.14 TRINITY_DN5119_c0_g1_i4:16-6468(-)